MDKDDPRIHQAEEYHRIVEQPETTPGQSWHENVRALVHAAREAAADLDAADKFGEHPLALKLWDALKPFEDGS